MALSHVEDTKCRRNSVVHILSSDVDCGDEKQLVKRITLDEKHDAVFRVGRTTPFGITSNECPRPGQAAGLGARYGY